MPNELTDKRIKELAEKCKRITDERGLYVINQDDYKNLQFNHLKNVVALIEKDGKFKCTFQGTTIVFETRHNPSYKKWYHIEWFTLLVAATLTVIGTVITNKLSNQEQSQELQKISDSLAVQKESLNKLNDSVYNHLSDSTLHK